MPGEESDIKSRVARKLSKHHRPLHRLPPTQIPDRFHHGEDEHEDVTAPTRGAGTPQQYMNQSIFSMIAAAGSRTDFNARFDELSDTDEEADRSGKGVAPDQRSLQSASETRGRSKDRLASGKQAVQTQEGESRKDTKPERKLLHVLPKLHLRAGKAKQSQTQSVYMAGPTEDRDESPHSRMSRTMRPRDAPMMSRLLEAQAEMSTGDLAPEVETPAKASTASRKRSDSSPEALLSTRLMEIFTFENPEKVVSEYPCWLLQSVLLQGYMYITEKHLCFYSYLPKKSNAIAKSGHLAKRGRRNPNHHRYWFILKGDVLSYYANPSDLYFPSGNIDLRYGISAKLGDGKDRAKDVRDFVVETDHRTYYFRADSATSAKEWVKTLQKTIFRSHNDGDSVKVSLPIENIVDLEKSPVIDFADTFKVRVVDNDESYAIDEYFFSFFSFGEDAFNTLQRLIESNAARQHPDELQSLPHRDRASRASEDLSPSSPLSVDPMMQSVSNIREMQIDPARATMRPLSPGPVALARSSGELGKRGRDRTHKNKDVLPHQHSRADFKRGGVHESSSRASIERQHVQRPSVLHQQESIDSFVNPTEPTTDSSVALESGTDTQGSASQLLDRSDVFHAPTTDRHDLSREEVGERRRRSEDTARSPLGSRGHSVKDQESHGAVAPSSIDFDAATQRPQSAQALQDILKAGSYPLQRAAGFAEYLRNTSKQMSSLLATESIGYYEKVSGMWAGGRQHYGENEGIMPEHNAIDPEDEEEAVGHGDRFRSHFALPASEKLQATYFCFLHRVLPLYGKVYISNRNFCFRSLLPGTKTKLILPLRDLENVDKEKGFRFGYHGLVLVIRGHEELFFEFKATELRDDCAITLLRSLESVRYLAESGILADEEKEDAEHAKEEHMLLQQARQAGHAGYDMTLPLSSPGPESIPSDSPPVLFDDPRASIINFKPTESLRITCLTIGSRGDVQPYIALCKGLIAEGHKPRIASHAEFEPWVRKHGIDFVPVGGDPAELMRICVENGMFTYSFLKEASVKFRSWLDELMSSAWKACQGSDLLIESPSAMAGIHIAEALGIPYFRAFTMPWTRTRSYPHAFAVPEKKLGGAYNYFSYVMFDAVFWKAIAGQVNRWRKNELGLRSTNLDRMQPNKVPFLYNFSPHVVIPPLDYSDWVRVTGYWFLDEGSDWVPPKELTDFIAKARADKKKLVYIGFGSIVVADPVALTKTVVESVLKADVRCILSKGWSDRLGDPSAVKTEVPLPSEILQIKSAPHDWLFSQIDAAAHHGGAGTTGASLRAGLPTIIKPFFGDQFFFGSRVEDLGVGICLKKVNVSVFSRALWEASNSERMILKARLLGEEIRKENGVETAIQAIHRDLEYAKTLIKSRQSLHSTSGVSNNPEGTKLGADIEDELASIEESWTFIGDESDPELTKRIRNFDVRNYAAEKKRESIASRASSIAERGGDSGVGVRRGKGVVETVEPTLPGTQDGGYRLDRTGHTSEVRDREGEGERCSDLTGDKPCYT